MKNELTRKEGRPGYNERGCFVCLTPGTKYGTLPIEFKIGILSMRSMITARLSSTAYEPMKFLLIN